MIMVREFLDSKSNELFSVSPDESVAAALAILSARRIGAVLVLDGTRLVGILSERDCAIRVCMPGLQAGTLRVREVMTAAVLSVGPEQPLEDCMQLMIERDIRHVPVLEHERVIGMISIGDVVKETLKQQRWLIGQLQAYIGGTYTSAGVTRS
jgi:CBS domain-containing protein